MRLRRGVAPMEVSGCTSYEAVFRQSVYRRIRDCAYRKTPTEQAELFCRSEAFAFAPDINDIYRDSREIWGNSDRKNKPHA